MTYTLTYVSISTLPPEESEEAVQQIISISQRNNAADNITGALIFTGTDFAQTLEGPKDKVQALMDRIGSDARHRNIEIIHEASDNRRAFSRWSMAYNGMTSFVRRQVEATRQSSAHEIGHDVAHQELRRLMLTFALGSQS